MTFASACFALARRASSAASCSRNLTWSLASLTAWRACMRALSASRSAVSASATLRRADEMLGSPPRLPNKPPELRRLPERSTPELSEDELRRREPKRPVWPDDEVVLVVLPLRTGDVLRLRENMLPDFCGGGAGCGSGWLDLKRGMVRWTRRVIGLCPWESVGVRRGRGGGIALYKY